MPDTITFGQVHPYIRYVQFLHEPAGSYFLGRCYDGRLFYVRHGACEVEVQGVKYQMNKGDLLIFGPGTIYQLGPDLSSHPEIISINFDYLYNAANPVLPIPPDTVSGFDESCLLSLVRFSDLKVFNAPLYLRNMELLDSFLLEMKREYETRRLFYHENIAGIFLTVLSWVARVSTTAGSEARKNQNHADAIIAYLSEHYAEDLTSHQLSEVFHFHPNYINRLITRHTGMSTHQYILMQRISQAMRLIQTTDLSLTQIAYMVGFQDLKHFSKMFKLKTGKAPSEFRMV